MPARQTNQMFRQALQLHQAGLWSQAEALYRQILAQDPRHADALHFLGMLAHQVGNHAVAVELMQHAIAIAPSVPHYHSNLAAVFRAIGRYAEAIDACHRALALAPEHADAHANLGLALHDHGQTEQAITSYRKALELKPECHVTHNNLGVALQRLGHLADASASYAAAIALRPDYADAYANLASLRIQRGRWEQAVEHCRQTLALCPNHFLAHFNLGNAQRKLGLSDQAIESYRQAAILKADYVPAWHNLGNVLTEQGRVEEAIEAYRRAVELRPQDASAHSSLLYALQFHPHLDSAAIVAEQQRWQDRHAAPLAVHIRAHLNDRTPQRRLRIGYVSCDFRQQAVGRMMTALLAHHDHARFEIVCYSDVRRPDDLTQRLRSCADAWHDTAGFDHAELADLIRRDGIDILVDLYLHSADNRLPVFARKPAPVQATYLGYAASTGLSAMDYRLTDPYLSPPGQPPEGPEKLACLPGCYWCYTPYDAAPDVTELPALGRGHIVFASFNNAFKVNGQVVALWARLLHAVPQSRLHIMAPGRQRHARLVEAFAVHGIDPARVQLLEPRPFDQYWPLYSAADIALDPFPYNGGVTSLDGLWMGVPFVTLPGPRSISRGGATILHHVGLPELIASTPDHYVGLAAALAADLPRLAHLRRTLRQRLRQSPLMDGPGFARGVEAAYRRMWRAWCLTPAAPMVPSAAAS